MILRLESLALAASTSGAPIFIAIVHGLNGLANLIQRARARRRQ